MKRLIEERRAESEASMDGSYFSVIIPVYNVEQYLEECVNSVLEQSYRDYEVILVDDGSTDTCPEICERYASVDKRVRVFHKQNGGSSSARNMGIDKAKGKYILFLDSDDFLSNRDCLKELEQLTVKGSFDCVLFKSKKLFDNGETKDYYGDYNLSVFSKEKTEIFKYMVKDHKQLACAWNRIVSREILQHPSMRFIEDTVGEDIPWTVALFEQANKIGATNAVYHMYRQGRDGSITDKTDVKKCKDLFNIIRILEQKYHLNYGKFGKAVMNFLAFEYAILLRTIAVNDFETELKEVFSYKWILKYALDKKAKAVKFLFKFLPIRYALRILKMS